MTIIDINFDVKNGQQGLETDIYLYQ